MKAKEVKAQQVRAQHTDALPTVTEWLTLVGALVLMLSIIILFIIGLSLVSTK